MAQPVFDHHPLEVYLRENGEAVEPIPGGLPEFTPESGSEGASEGGGMLPTCLLEIVNILNTILSLAHHPSPFVERFKYDVISSSLLSPDFTTPHARHQTSFHLPGRLSSGHSRAPSADTNATEISYASQHPAQDSCPEDLGRWPVNVILAYLAVFVIYCIGYSTLAALVVGVSLYYFHLGGWATVSKPVITSSLSTLKDLIAAGDVWDSVVHEAMSMLESEEGSIFYGPSNPTSPSSAVRVALQSSLHTTQTQCDNVRQLFSVLTSPSELSQLSEMYAPTSPMKTGFPSPDPSDNPRPLSVPTSPSRSHSSSSRAKRSTWNGSYSTLASAGSPTMQVLKRRERRRSDLSSLVELTSSKRSSVSASDPISSGLIGVQEEDDSYPEPNLSFSGEAKSQFGIEALDLQRRHRSGGMEALGLSSTSHRGSIAPTHSASRFTTMHTTRHPLSLSALNHALQSAVASKRYACSHLLALRFNEEDDEGYWEDVRSVMGLLTTTLVEASARLTEALEEAEKQKLQDQTPSLPSHSRNPSSSFSIEDEMRRSCRPQTQTMAQMVSFAPMPSHLSRFAAHVDAISSALNDAREHLERCVASLREHPNEPSPSRCPPPEAQHESPLQAYERMRRELGLALRECERGRERLLHILVPTRGIEDPDSADDVPALGHDACSDESDKPDSALDDPTPAGPIGFTLVPQGDYGVDDATPHLLLTATSQHLPPQGIEQVFEADSGAEMLFSRERSKLTREERIQAAKARRRSGGVGLGPDVAGPKPGIERWGPGGEVVQELKDVIWKVGERRRRMTEGQFAASTES